MTGPLGGLADEYVLGTDELARLDDPALLWPADDLFGDLDAGHHIAGLLRDDHLRAASAR